MNVFFNFRSPAPSIWPIVLLLVSHPIGKLFAFSLPITVYRLPRALGGGEFSFNPGPWNIKEHVLVFIMANVAVGAPYALNAVVVAEVFYGIHLGFWFTVVLVLATQLTGFGLAGLCRRFLVWPASMVWPQNLVICTLLNTLHAEDDEGAGGVTRYRYFMYVFGGAFFFFFLPNFLFQALAVFSWVCWLAPRNVPLNQVFGIESGMGLSILTFDWTRISWIGSPLMIPWWAEVHIFVGFVLFYWILTPALYYTNVSPARAPPLSSCGADAIRYAGRPVLEPRALPDVRDRAVRPLRQRLQRDARPAARRHLQRDRVRRVRDRHGRDGEADDLRRERPGCCARGAG